MPDLLIPDVPDDVVAVIDGNARRLGLSRSEYLRRQLARDAIPLGGTVTADDLTRFSESFDDLGDPDVLADAWR